MFSSILLLVFVSLGFSQEGSLSTEPTYKIVLACHCEILTLEGVLTEGHGLPYQWVFGQARGASPEEATLCQNDLLNNLSLSCARAYARAIGACRKKAFAYSSGDALGRDQPATSVPQDSCLPIITPEDEVD